MKTICGLIILSLASCAIAQYGIPDDDDEPAPATQLRSFSSYIETQQPARLQIVREEPLNYAAPPPANPVRFETAQTYYEEPAPISVRTEAPQTYSQVEKVIVRENIPSYSAPSLVRVQDIYSSQPAYTPEIRKEVIPIVKYVMQNDHQGTFSLDTVSGDGTTSLKNGQLRNLGGEEGPVQVMSGSYSFTGDDGKQYRVDWTADERGFIATGDHLPTTPAPFH